MEVVVSQSLENSQCVSALTFRVMLCGSHRFAGMCPPLTTCISRAAFAVALCVGPTAFAQAPESQPINSSSATPAAAAPSVASRAPMQISLTEDALAHSPSTSNHTVLEASVGITNAWQVTGAIAAQTVTRGNQTTKQFDNVTIGAARAWTWSKGSLQTAVGVEFELPLSNEGGGAAWSPTFSLQKQFNALHSFQVSADGKYAMDFPRRKSAETFAPFDDMGTHLELHASALLPFRAFSLTTEVSYLPDGLLESARGTYVAPGVAIPVAGAFEVGLSVSQHMTAPHTRSLGFRVMYQF